MSKLVVFAMGAGACLLAVLSCVPQQRSTFPAIKWSVPVYELRNGHWFNGRGFVAGTKYTVYGRITDRRPEPVDSVIDLNGAYVLPPFGEAHNHNAVPSDSAISGRYLRAGIFYVKNPSNLPGEKAAAESVFNTPAAIDVSFSNGGITGPGGHPIALARRNIARGVWNASQGEGAFYHEVASRAEFDRKWPQILAGRPDFIKTFLLFSEEYAERLRDSSKVGWRGLDPALLPYIVAKSHAARLRVSAHVETAADFRAAVAARVDEISHLPGFRPEGGAIADYGRLERYRLSADDARRAARNGVAVVTTVSEVLELATAGAAGQSAEAALAREVRDMLVHNLRVLRDAGVKTAIGSDRYRMTSEPEVAALRSTGLFSDTALVRMWSVDTPRNIFPQRDIGSFESGYEASFVALDGNPLEDFSALRRIRLRMKEGMILR